MHTMSDKEVVILLVEDDEVDQLAMKRAFEKLKIANNLVIAEDGIEALKILRTMNGGDMQRPYLIILDLNMPRMNGHEFLKELRADERLKDSVVFVLTTSSDEKDVVESYNMNVAGYVVKGNLAGSFMEAVNMIEHYWRIVELPE
jgi:CheY-like chemotaxis protein